MVDPCIYGQLIFNQGVSQWGNFSTNHVVIKDYFLANGDFNLYIKPYTNIKSIESKDLNVRYKTINFLEQMVGIHLCNFG